MVKKFTLGKTERLKSRKAIDDLFEKGQSFTVPPLRVIYLITQSGGLQFAVGVSARHFKKAVDRNTIKRKIREAYRLQKIPLQELLQAHEKGMNVFFTYNGKEIPAHTTVVSSVDRCLSKLVKKIENHTPDT
ncbi:MAG TPA: ribonuclease P protein component [Chitinophagaceae bacterium]|nr:ribonuclease P protein component [Chitinophagaceae bacterium]